MAEDWGLAVEAQEKGLSYKVGALTLNKNDSDGSNISNNAINAVGIKGGSQSATSPFASSGVNKAKNPSSASLGINNSPSADTGTNSADEETGPTPEQQSLLRKFLHSKLVTTKADLEVLRKDPHSPLYSVKSFDALNLKPELLKGVYDMGFNAPSKIQETALPTLLADPPENMIAQSQSGTGKTAAFVLTMLSRVDTSKCYPQCLCLSPTYELALQTGHVTEMMSKHMPDVSIAYAVRGGERPARGSHLTNHILIGTPGTVLDWATQIRAFDLKKIKVFVLDEADVMIATQGHKDQSIRIQSQLSKSCQVLLFSATYDTEVIKFTQKILPNAMTIRLRREEESLENIKQYYIECHSAEEKLQALSNIYGTISIGQSMIFCHTRRNASWLAEKMTKQGHAVALLSGELAIDQRAAVIARFRDGKEKVLITTNVTARGIDVEQVTVVVNFDLPVTNEGHPDCETYLHRIGRTGRFGKAGLAINFIDGPRAMNTLLEIEKHFGRKVERLDADDVDEIEKIGT